MNSTNHGFLNNQKNKILLQKRTRIKKLSQDIGEHSIILKPYKSKDKATLDFERSNSKHNNYFNNHVKVKLPQQSLTKTKTKSISERIHGNISHAAQIKLIEK